MPRSRKTGSTTIGAARPSTRPPRKVRIRLSAGRPGLSDAGLETPARLREELEAAPQAAHGHARKDQIVGADARRERDPGVLALEPPFPARPPLPAEGHVQDGVEGVRVDVEAGVELDRRVGEVPETARGVDGQAGAFDGQALDRDVVAPPREEDGQAAEGERGLPRRRVAARRGRGPDREGLAVLGDDGPDAPGLDGRRPRLEDDRAVLDEPPLDDEREREEGQRPARLRPGRGGRRAGHPDLGSVEEDGEGLAVPEEREVRDLDADPPDPDGRRVRERAEVLDDEGRREVGDREAVVGVGLPDPLADLVEEGVLADDEDDGEDGQDEDDDGGPADLPDEGPDLLADPEDRVEPHVFTFLQSARNRSTPMSVSGWRTSLVMTP